MFCYDQGVFYALYKSDEMLTNLDSVLQDLPVSGTIAIVALSSNTGRAAMKHCFGNLLWDDGRILRGITLKGTLDTTPGEGGIQLETGGHLFYDLSADDDVLVFPEVIPLSRKFFARRQQVLHQIGQVVRNYQPCAAA